MAMQREVIPVGPIAANCCVLWRDPASAWVVDPGFGGEAILRVMREKGLTAGVVVLTHAHFDHISGVTDFLAAHPVPVYLHADDIPYAFSPLNAMPPYPRTPRPATLATDKRDGDTLSCGGLSARIIHTPGHTPGSWCLHFEDERLLVAGDTLFAGSIGRTDFPGGNGKDMKASLKKLRMLPDGTEVLCGHGDATTIGAEKRENPYFGDTGFLE